MTYYRKTDNAKAQIVEHSPVTNSVYVQFADEPLTEVLTILEFGAVKYAPENWRYVDNARTRYFDAAQRHIMAWWQGEQTDSESGKHHLAHAVCCLMFLMWFDLVGGINE